jgi:hypothetical protein
MTFPLWRFQAPSPPIIVRVLEPDDSETFDFADLLVQALGLSGALILGALALGLIIGAVFIGLNYLRARSTDDSTSASLSITSPRTKS